MNQLVELIESHPACTEPEYEQHALYKIRLSRTVGPYDTGEICVQFANNLFISIRFKILNHHVVDNKSGLSFSNEI